MVLSARFRRRWMDCISAISRPETALGNRLHVTGNVFYNRFRNAFPAFPDFSSGRTWKVFCPGNPLKTNAAVTLAGTSVQYPVTGNGAIPISPFRSCNEGQKPAIGSSAVVTGNGKSQ